jgi:hypothetical protein
MMKIGPNAPALDGLCIWMMQISSMYIGHEEDFNFIGANSMTKGRSSVLPMTNVHA